MCGRRYWFNCPRRTHKNGFQSMYPQQTLNLKVKLVFNRNLEFINKSSISTWSMHLLIWWHCLGFMSVIFVLIRSYWKVRQCVIFSMTKILKVKMQFWCSSDVMVLRCLKLFNNIFKSTFSKTTLEYHYRRENV